MGMALTGRDVMNGHVSSNHRIDGRPVSDRQDNGMRAEYVCDHRTAAGSEV